MRFTIPSASARAALAGMAGLMLFVFAAHAQERPPRVLDTACASDCTAGGYASEYCDRICRVAPPPRVRADELTDWACMSTCSDRGGTYAECKPRCRLP